MIVRPLMKMENRSKVQAGWVARANDWCATGFASALPTSTITAASALAEPVAPARHLPAAVRSLAADTRVQFRRFLAAPSCNVSFTRTRMWRVETNRACIRKGGPHRPQPSVSVQLPNYPSEYRRIVCYSLWPKMQYTSVHFRSQEAVCNDRVASTT